MVKHERCSPGKDSLMTCRCADRTTGLAHGLPPPNQRNSLQSNWQGRSSYEHAFKPPLLYIERSGGSALHSEGSIEGWRGRDASGVPERTAALSLSVRDVLPLSLLLTRLCSPGGTCSWPPVRLFESGRQCCMPSPGPRHELFSRKRTSWLIIDTG